MNTLPKDGMIKLNNLKYDEIPELFKQELDEAPQITTVDSQIEIEIYQDTNLEQSALLVSKNTIGVMSTSVVVEPDARADYDTELVFKTGKSKFVTLDFEGFKAVDNKYKLHVFIDLVEIQGPRAVVRCLISGKEKWIALDVKFAYWLSEDSLTSEQLAIYLKLINIKNYGNIANLPYAAVDLTDLFDSVIEKNLIKVNDKLLIKNEILKSITKTQHESDFSNKYLPQEIKRLFHAIINELEQRLNY